ncbi:hypothetical protein MK280_04000, partial [Myxococcota bacterium]|nr:hypothetical protein [Myxococcota bacterium]
HKYGVVRSGKAALRFRQYRAAQWWERECHRPYHVLMRRGKPFQDGGREDTSGHRRTQPNTPMTKNRVFARIRLRGMRPCLDTAAYTKGAIE